ncbi:DNA internalization-related competence protein ComEC/Rec2 [Cohnella herbarum]|uniref:DNA internalization-related competence protein ComEC/Rec2 n=1 Tax=Cohnella herbarum TaxID=2728023 RepID=A0A7Z2VI73_9BACL|nr:DNA internalization-related competence protein ComEC/Rec2 [Cohnella herbarum]QJD83683.1 DNA internalization-related competence protein ComEC/Rec2 [Cohnella herbarum]
MNGRPLVAVCCCWIVGVSIESLVQGFSSIIVLVALILFLIGLAILGKLNPKLTFICGLALLLAYGERAWVENRNESDLAVSTDAVGAEAVLTGRSSSVIEVDGDVAMFKLKAESIKRSSAGNELKITDTVLIRIKLAKQEDQQIVSDWRRGDRIRIAGVLELPGEAGNFGAFDYRNYLSKQGIHWQLSAKGLNSVTFTGEPGSILNVPLRVLDDLRMGIGKIMDRMYPGGDSGYMKGLVVGIRSDLEPEQFDQFARLGLTHVLAISGLHVGVVVYLLLQIGAWMRLTRERTLDMTIAMMPLYMLITGASPSAVRACVMAMIALWLARKNALKDGLHLLMAAALLMLIWNPLLIENVSFQLSFIVTAGLILFVPTVTASLPIRWNWLKGAVAVTLTAQFVSFPVTVYYFNAVHLLSLPANFVLVPFISFIVMPLGMASIVLGGIWLPMGIIPAKLASMGNALTFGIVDWLDAFVGLRSVWPKPSLLWVASAYVLMGLAIAGLKQRLARKLEREWWKQQAVESEDSTAPLSAEYSGNVRNLRRTVLPYVAFAFLAVSWLLWGYRPAAFDRDASISFLNVGQGDSILIRTGKGKIIMIDAGGTVNFRKPGEEWKNRSDPYEVGRKLIVPLLLKRGFSDIDALVLTHFDADHIGGAEAVLNNIPVRSLLFNGTLKDSPSTLKLLRLTMDKNIPSYAVQATMEWEVDETTKLLALYPYVQQSDPENRVEVRNEQNDLSIVFILTVYGRNFLLPGDLEAGGERDIVEIESERDGNVIFRQIDVLKAGHHGSKTSTTEPWVDYWSPRETVISVGINNFYGHPNEGVLERLKDAGSLIWRTDLHGEVQYRIQPNGDMERRMMRDAE